MGAINYYTSQFITLALMPYDFTETEEYIKNNYVEFNLDGPEDVTPDLVYDEINEYYNCDYENAKYIIDKYDFNILDISIEAGYYEGYSINIKFDWNYFDDTSEKRDAQKELTQLKKCLYELAGVGYMACRPFWCTSYKNYNDTIKDIDTAIKEARAEFRKIPTYYTKYIKNAKEA